MSMYRVNASIPKTLVRHLVRYVADHSEPRLRGFAGCWTPCLPELLPPKDGEIAQRPRSVGALRAPRLFLYYMLQFGFAPGKIYRMACRAFAGVRRPHGENGFPPSTGGSSQQFKRSCLPDGPKVGSVTLSPGVSAYPATPAGACGQELHLCKRRKAFLVFETECDMMNEKRALVTIPTGERHRNLLQQAAPGWDSASVG
ncbi:MAG: hypothetical protein ACLRSY_09010 [Acutalibacter sp.]